MKVPLRIKRVQDVRPLAALLLPDRRGEALLRLCAALQMDPLPGVYAVADGFLVRFGEGRRSPGGERLNGRLGVIGLAEVGTNLLVPVDGRLVPGLLADESAALGRNRGLIFLPEGRVLAFDPDRPLPWSDFLVAAQGNRPPWRSLRIGNVPAENLTEIVLNMPEPEPEKLLDAGGEGIGIEEPRPEDSSLAKKMLGRVSLGMGKGLSWLGNMLNSPGLAQAGARAMDFALGLFPRMSEKLLGRQEACLRELLRAFRAGDVEQALRRALPLDPNLGRGAQIHPNAELPVHDTRYSLGNILAGGGGGGIWLARIDVLNELAQEYRKQAEAATRRGDFRRAAFIYGKLLKDYRLAAAVLAQGGLHHDAALLNLQVVGDHLAAARQFELAGEQDRALQIYRQYREHVRAGDLLRSLGEEDMAVAEYQQAAEQMISSGRGYDQAGELMLDKAARPDLAQQYFVQGWAARPNASAPACARRLAQLHAEQGNLPAIQVLAAEAEKYFAPAGNETVAGEFFNHLVHLAQEPALASIREDLHDRALTNLAGKLRQNCLDTSRANTLVPQMFAVENWPANLLTDAHHALRLARSTAETLELPARSSQEIKIQAAIPVVRCVCQVAATEEIFLGFESGEVVCFHPVKGTVRYLENQIGPVQSLVVSMDGETVVVLSRARDKDEVFHLACYTRCEFWIWSAVRHYLSGDWSQSWLTPSLSWLKMESVGFLIDQKGVMHWLRLPNLLPHGTLALPDLIPGIALLLPAYEQGKPSKVLAAFNGGEMMLVSDLKTGKAHSPRPCPLFNGPDSFRSCNPLQYISTGRDSFEMTGVSRAGRLFWLRLRLKENHLEELTFKNHVGSFQAVTPVRAGKVIAVDKEAVFYLSIGETGVKIQHCQRFKMPEVVACYVCQRSKELILVSSGGSLIKLPLKD